MRIWVANWTDLVREMGESRFDAFGFSDLPFEKRGTEYDQS